MFLGLINRNILSVNVQFCGKLAYVFYLLLQQISFKIHQGGSYRGYIFLCTHKGFQVGRWPLGNRIRC